MDLTRIILLGSSTLKVIFLESIVVRNTEHIAHVTVPSYIALLYFEMNHISTMLTVQYDVQSLV